ncbi:muscle M-line assembly protein unc-89-like [Erythrolamprus reginae]|uniref:muscle M-line assembly protein unc-89-like n=1 Tax=Erythrolamprus reginae TaxID=121349 RepID=UPI00396C58BF
MASDIFRSSLFLIVLSSLSSVSTEGIEDKDPWLSQPQASVLVTIGDVLHLECEVHNTLQPGAVKWLLSKIQWLKLIYTTDETDERDERITRSSPGSDTDFSISIRNVTPEDAGIYYCVKETKRSWGFSIWLEGFGTWVRVKGIKDKDSRLSQTQASVSVLIGDVLHLKCNAYSIYQTGSVKWFLGKGPHRKLIYANDETGEQDERITRKSPGSDTDFSISIHNVTPEDAGTYYCAKEDKRFLESTVWLEGFRTQVCVKGIEDKDPWLSQPQTSVSVTLGDVLHLKCEVHSTLQPGAVKWFLGEGPQWKLIYADTKFDEIDERITRKYPGCNMDFSISIHNVTVEDEGTYYCVKEKKEVPRSTIWLKGPGTQVFVRASRWNDPTIPLAVGISVCILVCLFGVVLFVYLSKKAGLRNNHARSDTVFPEKQQLSKPTSGDKEIVYADLKDPSELQTPRRIDSGERSEYATITVAPTVAADKGSFHSLNL